MYLNGSPRPEFQLRRLLLLLAMAAACSLSEGAETRNYQLFRIRPDGSELEQLTHRHDWSFGSPDWSPDGRRIAADAWLVAEFERKSFSATHLFVMNADGSELQEIGMGAMPSWSPNGKQLTCHTYDSPQTIVVINDDGTGREVVAGHWGSPRWSPQGQWIASLSRGQFALLNLVTGREKLIAMDRSQWLPRLAFSWSPDGRRIAFTDTQGRGLAILTLDDQGEFLSVQPRVREVPGARTPWMAGTSWSPDGRQIAFCMWTDNRSPSQLYIVETDGETRPRRVPRQPAHSNNSSPDWSPDGQWILFCNDVPD